jgi:hypothetical protein
MACMWRKSLADKHSRFSFHRSASRLTRPMQSLTLSLTLKRRPPLLFFLSFPSTSGICSDEVEITDGERHVLQKAPSMWGASLVVPRRSRGGQGAAKGPRSMSAHRVCSLCVSQIRIEIKRGMSALTDLTEGIHICGEWHACPWRDQEAARFSQALR